MSLHRMVDGKRVELTPEEENEVRAQWAANNAETKIIHMRHRRDELLKATDTTVIRMMESKDTRLAQYSLYRQALRDVPQAFPTGDNVVWPEFEQAI